MRDAANALTATAETIDRPDPAAVATVLGISERTARTRYGGGPRELPLLIALDER